MKREGFLKLVAGVALAPYLAKIPSGAPKVVPAEATKITVAPGYFRVGDIIRNTASGEAMRVTKIQGAEMTVIRGIGAKSAGPKPIRSADELLLIGGATAEGADLVVRG